MADYYDPHDLVVGAVVAKLETDVNYSVDTTDVSRVDLIETYDFSGDPTKPDQTANRILVKPDTEIGDSRGFRDRSHAIGYGPRTWEYYVMVEIECFPIKTTKDRATVRDIASKVAGRVKSSLHEMSTLRNVDTLTTADGKWAIIMPTTPFIQGGGIDVQDAGRSRSIRTEQKLVVGFILQYTGG